MNERQMSPNFVKLCRGEIEQRFKEKRISAEMQRMLQDDGGVIIMAFTDYLDARRSNVKGIVPHPSGPLGFYQFATNVWIDA